MKILHATDGSEHAEAAEQLLKRIPFPADSRLAVASVIEKPHPVSFGDFLDEYATQELRRDQIGHANSLLRLSTARLSGVFETVSQRLLEGHAADEITRLAESERADLVCVGARGRNALERFLLGSTSEKILNHAPCSVLLAHSPGMHQQSSAATSRLKMLVAFDGSPATGEAVDTLARLRLSSAVEVTLLYVHSLVTSFRADILQRAGQQWQREETMARTALDQAARRLESSGADSVSATVHEAPDVANEILSVADEWQADIVLAGDTGKSGVDRFLIGSVCRRLAHHARCGVWVTRKPHRQIPE